MVKPILTWWEKQQKADDFIVARGWFKKYRAARIPTNRLVRGYHYEIAKYGNDPVVEAYRSLPILSTHGIVEALAVILRVKPKYPTTGIPITQEKAEEAVRIYLRQINYELFGSAFTKHGKQLRQITQIEKRISGYLHINLTIEVPETSRISKADFINLLTRKWRRIDWSNGLPKIADAPTPDGWVRYGSKLAQKSGLDAYGDHIVIGRPGNHQRLDATNPEASGDIV